MNFTAAKIWFLNETNKYFFIFLQKELILFFVREFEHL